MARRGNSASRRLSGSANSRSDTYQLLMAQAVKERDDLDVFIRILSEKLETAQDAVGVAAECPRD